MSKHLKYILFFFTFILVLYLFIIPSFNTSCNPSDYDSGYNGFMWGTNVLELENKFNTSSKVRSNSRVITVVNMIDRYELETHYIFDKDFGLYSIELTFKHLLDFTLLEKRLTAKLGKPQKSKVEEFWGALPSKQQRKILKWYNQSIEVTLKEHYNNLYYALGDAIYIVSKKIKNNIENREQVKQNLKEELRLKRERMAKDSITF